MRRIARGIFQDKKIIDKEIVACSFLSRTETFESKGREEAKPCPTNICMIIRTNLTDYVPYTYNFFCRNLCSEEATSSSICRNPKTRTPSCKFRSKNCIEYMRHTIVHIHEHSSFSPRFLYFCYCWFLIIIHIHHT